MTAVALIGVGGWGRHVARDLVALGVEVTAVCRSPRSAENARAAGVARVVERAGEIGAVDGVVVCTPTATHADVIDAVAGLGVPIFVEKPLTARAARARELVERLGDRLFVMDKWRYHGGVRGLADVARSGRLGAPRGLTTRRVGGAFHHTDVDAVWILMPHELSIALEVFGRALDPVAAVAAFAGGEIVRMHAVMGGECGDPWHVAEISTAHEQAQREISLVCEHGAVTVPDPYADHILVREFGAAGDPEQIPVSTEMPLLLELTSFIGHLRGGPPPVSSAAEGLRSVELIERLRELAGAGG